MAFKSVLILWLICVSGCIYFIHIREESMNWHSDNKRLIPKCHPHILHANSNYILGLFRVFSAALFWSVLLSSIFDRGLTLTVFVPHGKTKVVTIRGLSRLTTFTMWNWTLLGVYFTLASLQSFNLELLSNSSDIIANITVLLYETLFPMAFVVSYIVTYVIIPTAKAHKISLDPLFSRNALLCHNANIVLIGLEAILNRLPVNVWRFPFVMLFACSYVAFSWIWYYFNGFLYYRFLDWSIDHTIPVHLALIVFSMIVFGFGYLVSELKSFDFNIAAVVITVAVYGGIKLRRK